MWEPIANQDNKVKIVNILQHICIRLDELKNSIYGTGIANGSAGICLYLHNVHIYLNDDCVSNILDEYISILYKGLQANNNNLSFFTGLSGSGFCLDCIGADDENHEDTNEDIDDLILEQLDKGWNGDYELSVGLIGLGVYALNRIQNPTSLKILGLIVNIINDTKVKVDLGYVWSTNKGSAFRNANPTSEFNLGLAHGVPGVVAFLALLHLKTGDMFPCRILLEKACEGIIAQRQSGPFNSEFPYEYNAPSSSRLAWCYGDLSIAIVLLNAGISLKNELIKSFALEIAHKCCERNRQTYGDYDLGFCHGISGLLHQFNILYQVTGTAIFKEKADSLLSEIVQAYEKEGNQLSALNMFDKVADNYKEEPGVLAGYAGIGLILLSTISNTLPRWSEGFLLPIIEVK